MKRRIIKQGHNTLTVTLPADWVKRLNVKAGDEVDLIEKESSLIINGFERNKEKCASIDINGLTIPMLWRHFQSAYRSGCDEIKIIFDPNAKQYEDAYHFYTTHFDYAKLGEKFPSKPAIAMIQGLVDRFIGMGIIETGKNYCIVREMGEPAIKEFDSSLRRIFLIILELFDRTLEAIENDEIGEVSFCKEMHTIDLNIDRLVDYCCRILNKIHTSFPDSRKMLLFSTLYLLELVGDEFKYIGKHLAFAKKSVKDSLEIGKIVKEHFDLYYKMFYKFEKDSVVRFGKNDYDICGYHNKVKENLHGHSRSITRHFMMISKFSLALAELRIEMEY